MEARFTKLKKATKRTPQDDLGTHEIGTPSKRPRLLNGYIWTKQLPTENEWVRIAFLEEKMVESRQFYYEFTGGTFVMNDEKSVAISPRQYIDFLARSYVAYERENCKAFPHRAAVAEANLKFAKECEMPADSLGVVRFADRPIMLERLYSISGDRIDYDHTPPTSVVKKAVLENRLTLPDGVPVERDALTARAIPCNLHKQFHKEVTKLPDNPYEAAKAQMQWQRDGLIARGYSKADVLQSERHVHERNDDTGIYR